MRLRQSRISRMSSGGLTRPCPCVRSGATAWIPRLVDVERLSEGAGVAGQGAELEGRRGRVTASVYNDVPGGNPSGPCTKDDARDVSEKSLGGVGTVMAKCSSALAALFQTVLFGGRTRMNRRRMQVTYFGRVQGVGFRYQTRQLATGYEVTGTVRNLPDGQVELVAEGTEQELQAFRQGIRDCGMGPLIDREEDLWTDARGGFRGFEIMG